MIEVTYINHMGDDISVVNSARVSFGKKSKYECTDMIKGKWELSRKDEKLINYLAKHNHKSPFNHAFATFHVKAPIFVARQLQKHEYMPWNEISRRYVDSKPEFYEPDEWRGRSADKKQGSEGVVPISGETMRVSSKASMWSIRNYTALLNAGVAPEQARMVLPQSMMTEWYWSGSLYAFAKMCSLRCADDTQYETKLVAVSISDVMFKLFPISWDALRTEMYKEEEW
jgi:thymidylate synthase (FAD)|tara:strand:- start:2138 stop:2821 length:684 start_codon:yes stop_codon:yes gene_type:complete